MSALDQQDAFREFEFHVEGVHCANCLRKIDGLSQSLAPLESLNFDMSTNRLSFRAPDSLGAHRVIEEVGKLGFEGREYDESSDLHEELRKENRRSLIRLGVAAVSAGNIMLMAWSIYSGAAGLEAQFMNWMSLLLAVPALTYAAWPLYRSAWADLRNRKISVDLPVVVAILAGSVLSVQSILRGTGDVYLDSITALIFLILASRYFLSRVQSKYLGLGRLQNLFKIHRVQKLLDGGDFETVSVESLRPGDIVRVAADQVLPVDGELVGESASLDTSLLSGESRPRNFASGESVFMGMRNCGSAFRLKVTAVFEKSRINKMLKDVELAVKHKPRSIELLDKVGQSFLVVVLLLAALTFGYFLMNADPSEGVRRALALILVACPCTFAFGAPMVFSLGMVRAARDGLLIKHPSVFEKLLKVKDIVFDKTGTLTDGRYQLQEFHAMDAMDPKEASRILALVSQSEHPVSRSIRDEFLKRGVKASEESWDEVTEKPTVGLLGSLAGDEYLVNSSRVEKNKELMLQLKMGDQLWPEAADVVGSFRSQGKELFVLSGDNADNVLELSSRLGLAPSHSLSEQSPEMKNDFLEQHPRALMLGDGANDSLALAKAYVGVAVNGSLSSSLKASDVYLMKQDLRLLSRLTQLSGRVKEIIHQNLTAAVVYNVLVGALAITGFIHPLLAAVLMPISSLTQLFSALRVLKAGEAWT